MKGWEERKRIRGKWFVGLLFRGIDDSGGHYFRGGRAGSGVSRPKRVFRFDSCRWRGLRR